MRLLPFALLAVLLQALPACPLGPSQPGGAVFPADTTAGTLPIGFSGPGEAALVVPVFLNGQGPFSFVLDTGATITCLDARLADSLALPAVRGVTGIGAGVGGAGRTRLVTLDSIRLGEDATIGADGLRACVLDLAHIETVGVDAQGLVGLDVLRQFRLTLDFPAGAMRFDPPDAAR